MQKFNVSLYIEANKIEAQIDFYASLESLTHYEK